MKGIGKRVTVAFLSIVALLSVSGVISLFELSHLSYDTDAIISTNARDVGIARDLLRTAHNHSRAVIDMVIFNNESARERGNKALLELDSHIASVRDKASKAVQGSLDTLSLFSGELRRLTDGYRATEEVVIDSLTVVKRVDGRKWYVNQYEPAYNRLVRQVDRYITLSHNELAPRATQLSKNAYRSVAPVLISLMVMIAIVLMLYYFVYIYGVKPILRINRSLSDYLSFKLPFKPKAEMVDEIKELRDNIENLINISKSNKKQGEDAI